MAWYHRFLPMVSFHKSADPLLDPNLQTSIQTFTPGIKYNPRNYAHFVRDGYKRNGTVYNCINKIAGMASGIKWKLYTDESMKKQIEQHPFLDFWKRPNPYMGTGMFMEQLFGYWHLSGNSYVWAYRENPKKPPLALWHLRPDQVKLVINDLRMVENYIMGYGTDKARIFEPEDTLHLKFPAYDDDLYGLSPVEVAAMLIDQQNEGNLWNTALMQNAGKPASVFFSKSYLTTEQRNQVRDELRRRYQGKVNAGMPLVLEADMTWQQCSMSPYELDWLQGRELNTREIAAIFDIAPELVGDSAGKTFANVHEAKISLIVDNVLPKMDRVRDEVNRWLLPMWGLEGAYWTYDKEDIEALQELYQAAKDARSKRATDMWNSGQCTMAVAQELQGIAPDPQGDVYKFGSVLVKAEDLHTYAEQSLSKPVAPPTLVPENILNGTPTSPTKPEEEPPPTPPGKSHIQLLIEQYVRTKHGLKRTDPRFHLLVAWYLALYMQKVNGQAPRSVMIGFFLDPATAAQLALPDGEPPEELHITLAMLGDQAAFQEQELAHLRESLAVIANQMPTVSGTVSGLGRFMQPDITPVYASVNLAGLQVWRQTLIEALQGQDIPVDGSYDYTPHITLAYIEADQPMPLHTVPPLALHFTQVTLAIGDEHWSYPLNGQEAQHGAITPSLETHTATPRSCLPVRTVSGTAEKATPNLPAPALPSPVWQPPGVAEQIAAYQQEGITELEWIAQKDACELCAMNHGAVRSPGEAFPNGALVPQGCHPHCKCTVKVVKGKVSYRTWMEAMT